MEQVNSAALEPDSQQVLAEVDIALAEDSATRKAKRDQSRPPIDSRIDKLPQLLRAIGAIVLIAASGTFLVQNWGEMSHLWRYFSFLSFTVVVAVAGFFCGLHLKEDKGARTLLALAAAVLPVHFTQLGGMIYSLFHKVDPSDYSKYLYWSASPMEAGLACGLALVVLTPIVFTAFSSLCRAEARVLTGLFMFLNALLLVPVRSANMIGVLFAIGIAVVLFVEKTRLFQSSAMATKEGLFVRLMMVSTFGTLIGRTMFLYEITTVFGATLAACVAAGCLFHARNLASSKIERKLSEMASAWLSLLSVCGYVIALYTNEILTSAQNEYAIPLIVLPYAVILIGISLLATKESASQYRQTAAYISVLGMIVELLAFPELGLITAFLAILVGIVTIAYGYAIASGFLFMAGGASIFAGLVYYIAQAVAALHAVDPWIGLGALGVITVIAASYLERNKELFQDVVTRMKHEVRRLT